MCTGLKVIAILVVLMLAVACGPLAEEGPTSSPTTKPDLQATAVPAVEATATTLPTPAPTPATQFRTSDDLLGEANKEVPGFGGLFLDPKDNGIVYVYMLDPSQQEEAERAAKNSLDPDLFKRVRQVRVLQGQYSFIQLREWYDRFNQEGTVPNIPELTMSGIDKGKNRIAIGVDNNIYIEKVQKVVEEVLAKLGIPREAVIIRVVPRPVPVPLR